MKLKILCFFCIIFFSISALNAQHSKELVLNAYFDILVQQMQVNATISNQLQEFPPSFDLEYQELIAIPAQENVLLPWTYFLKKLERQTGGKAMVELCKEGQKTDVVVRRFHSLRIVDAFLQTTVDTAQSMQRLLFFDIAKGDRVAEIGFGYGYNLNLLGLVYEDIEIFANELDAYRVKKMEEEIYNNFPTNRRDNFHFVQGAEKSTNLEGKELDLIIMENVFHHIEEKEIFLQSMAMSLRQDGAVVLIEEFLDAERPGAKCRDLESRAEIEILFRDAGFKLVDQQELNGRYKTMIRFVKEVRQEWHE